MKKKLRRKYKLMQQQLAKTTVRRVKEYMHRAICFICNQNRMCRWDWMAQKPKCFEHGGMVVV